MSRPATVVSKDVRSRARGLRDYISRAEDSYRNGRLSETDLRRSYAGCFLQFYTYVENSIDRLFRGLLMQRYYTEKQDVEPLVEIQSERVAIDVIRGGRGYVNWLPIERTISRADAFFSSGRPFRSLKGSEKSVFTEVRYIRNAIAHSGSHSLRKFRKTFVAGRSLPPRQRRPEGYLRGQHSAEQTRLDYHFSAVAQVMSELCA